MINEKPRYFAPVNWRKLFIWCCMGAVTGLVVWVFCAEVVR